MKPHMPQHTGKHEKTFIAYNTTGFKERSNSPTKTLLVLLMVILGGSVLSGCQLGAGRNTSTGSNNGTQSGNTPGTGIPTLQQGNIQSVREAVIAKVRPAVVQVNVTMQRGGGLGSGVIIDPRGYIVTNNHVIDGAQSVSVVIYGGASVPAQITGTDPADDLAVVKINPSSIRLTVGTLGDSTQVRVGQEVMAMGNPLGITQTVTNGIVSALGRNIPEGQNGAIILNAIQTDAPINPGNSGGALVDLQGNVVGIPTLTAVDPEFNAPASGVGFAIPANRVKLIAPQLIQTGRVTHTGRAIMGVSATTVDAALATQNHLSIDHGALITAVASDSPAARAGLKVGDVVVRAANTQVNDISSLRDAFLSHNPGDTVPVMVYRGNQQLTVNVTLTEQQPAPGS